MTIRSYHEGTKDTKDSDIYSLKLRELRAFVVSPLFIAPFAFFAVKLSFLLWLRRAYCQSKLPGAKISLISSRRSVSPCSTA